MTMRIQKIEMEGVAGKVVKALAVIDDDFGKSIEIKFSDDSVLAFRIRVRARIEMQKFGPDGELLQEHAESA